MGLIKLRTVESGERAIVRSHTGHIRVVDGPTRLTLWRSKFQLLQWHIANPNQYLHVATINGENFIKPGPCGMFMNPLEHHKIETKNAFAVDAGEAIVIYKSGANGLSPITGENGTVGDASHTAPIDKSSRKVIRHGPLHYIPSVDELVKPLTRHFARQDEYLEIQDKNGEISIMEGPCTLLFDPIDHTAITTKSAVFVNAGEAMIIYRTMNQGSGSSQKGDVERKVLHGPTQYIPHPKEWTHEFCWHGVDPLDKTHLIQGLHIFTQLRTIADQIYYNVREVRTKDDTLLRVKLMIFFELDDIEQMLDNTHDPIGDFVNAAASDVVAFCAKLTYEDFLSKTTLLNDLSSFEQLCKRASSIGYAVNKVVFRGFHASDALQTMHDNSIQERTRLKLETDTELQRQSHLDMQLTKEEERADRAAKLEDEVHSRALKRQMEHHNLKMSMAEAEMGREVERLAKMKELGVDLTKVLVAEQRVPDRHLRIDSRRLGLAGEENGKELVNVNFHEHMNKVEGT